MTDRAHSVLVVLEADTRTDDLKPILSALRMVRGVAAVEVTDGNIAGWADVVARQRVRDEMLDAFIAFHDAVMGKP